MKELKFWGVVFYLTWELIIKETVTPAGQGLILCQVNGRTVYKMTLCLCPSEWIVCEGILCSCLQIVQHPMYLLSVPGTQYCTFSFPRT